MIISINETHYTVRNLWASFFLVEWYVCIHTYVCELLCTLNYIYRILKSIPNPSPITGFVQRSYKVVQTCRRHIAYTWLTRYLNSDSHIQHHPADFASRKELKDAKYSIWTDDAISAYTRAVWNTRWSNKKDAKRPNYNFCIPQGSVAIA